MKFIKSILAVAAAVFIGASAQAAMPPQYADIKVNVNLSAGADIKIGHKYKSTRIWRAYVGKTEGADGTHFTVTPKNTGSNKVNNWTVTVAAKSTATVGASETVSVQNQNGQGNYVDSSSDSDHNAVYTAKVIEPLRIKVGDTKSNVAANSGNTWKTGETDSGNVITVSTTGSGSSRNVSVKGDKVGDATCWMTNQTLTAGYFGTRSTSMMSTFPM